MKKYLFLAAVAALTLSSCKTTITHTATTQSVDTEIINRSTADLDVRSTKITYTFTPTKSHNRAGEKAVIRAAVAKALEENGNADVLVAPQYEVKKNFKGVKYVIVKGYPAFYRNVHATTQKEVAIVKALD